VYEWARLHYPQYFKTEPLEIPTFNNLKEGKS